MADATVSFLARFEKLLAVRGRQEPWCWRVWSIFSLGYTVTLFQCLKRVLEGSA
jgi:hypothetical protein